MTQCKCGSYAINDHLHGREHGVDLHLCDVCYWRNRAESAYRTLVRSHEASVKYDDDDQNTIGAAYDFVRR